MGVVKNVAELMGTLSSKMELNTPLLTMRHARKVAVIK